MPARNAADRTTAASAKLLSTADVGRANRSRVLQALADHGPLSRADLARLSGVPRGTIGGIVASLLTAGVLAETGERRPSTGLGKPSRPLWFGPKAGPIGAVFVQSGSVETAVVTADGTIVARGTEHFTPSASRDRLDPQLAAATDEVLRPYRHTIAGVGIAMPVTCVAETGELLASSPVPGLVGTRLPELVAERTGVPVVVEEDVQALAIGQRWFGRARGVDDFAVLETSAGIGVSIMLGGRLYRPDTSTTEIGHMCVEIDGERCRCGLRGCWETVASLRWLRREATSRDIPGARTTTPAKLARHADDPAVADLLDRYADHIAVGIANLLHLLSLRVFILHGDVVGGGEPLQRLIESAVRRRAMPILTTNLRVEFADPHQDTGLLGAAATALTRQLAIAV